ncbi:hypothetical protein H0H93_013410 [Arthromyces matolae]|nr:hypothetical protein H0H93_013410 [Arthromyces matolae]
MLIYENYSLQSGEGLSVIFVVIWLLGDLANLIGAIRGGLLSTVILLAVYYTICDMILLGQIFYYRWKQNRGLSVSPDEQEPLLNRPTPPPVDNIVLLIRYTGGLCFVFLVGLSAWWINGVEGGDEIPLPKNGWDVQILGWTSAVLYQKTSRHDVKGYPPPFFTSRFSGMSLMRSQSALKVMYMLIMWAHTILSRFFVKYSTIAE